MIEKVKPWAAVGLSMALLAGAPNSGSAGYTYDDVGNRLTRSTSGFTPATLDNRSFPFDPNDRLNTDTYDANGNTLFGAGFNQSQADRYDFENRLIERTIAGKTVTITYDGDGNRVRKTVTTPTNTVTTFFLVDTVNPTSYAQVLEEQQTTDNGPLTLTRVYTFGLTLLAQDQLLNGVWTVRYHGLDGHGSTRYLTDALGDITDTYDYDAFGNLIAATGVTPNNFLFTTEQLDPHLGLYFLRARYQDTSTGRFWTMDDYEGRDQDPESLHKYLYAHSNPVSFIDPSGHLSLFDWANDMLVRTLVYTSIRFPWAIKVVNFAVSMLLPTEVSVGLPAFGASVGIAGVGGVALWKAAKQLPSMQRAWETAKGIDKTAVGNEFEAWVLPGQTHLNSGRRNNLPCTFEQCV